MSHTATILLTRHEPALVEGVQAALAGVSVMPLDTEPPSAPPGGAVWCFVDWLPPAVSGLELCRRLRQAESTADSHITILLDADDSEAGIAEARRRALKAGADDYAVGPLTLDLILDRLRAYRRSPPLAQANGAARSGALHNGEVMLDPGALQLRYRRKLVPLRLNEFRLLAHFFEHPDQLFTRQQLIAGLGKDFAVTDERTVDVWIGRLRRSLKAQGIPDQIRTVRTLGYVLDSFDQNH